MASAGQPQFPNTWEPDEESALVQDALERGIIEEGRPTEPSIYNDDPRAWRTVANGGRALVIAWVVELLASVTLFLQGVPTEFDLDNLSFSVLCSALLAFLAMFIRFFGLACYVQAPLAQSRKYFILTAFVSIADVAAILWLVACLGGEAGMIFPAMAVTVIAHSVWRISWFAGVSAATAQRQGLRSFDAQQSKHTQTIAIAGLISCLASLACFAGGLSSVVQAQIAIGGPRNGLMTLGLLLVGSVLAFAADMCLLVASTKFTHLILRQPSRRVVFNVSQASPFTPRTPAPRSRGLFD